jgi:hypothetical protein
MSEIHDAGGPRKGEASAESEEGLLDILRERAARLDADVLGQVLTVASGMGAIGAETLADHSVQP